MLDGDQWIKLSKAHAQRREEWRRQPLMPAGEFRITEREIALANDLAELDNLRAARERGGDARRGTHKCPRIFDWLLGELERDPGATNRQLVERFPEDDLNLYRNDEGGFADDSHGTLSLDGFNRYVTDARQALGLTRRSPSRTT